MSDEAQGTQPIGEHIPTPDPSDEEQDSQELDESEPTPDRRQQNILANYHVGQDGFYYPNACHLCGVFRNKLGSLETCNGCNLVSYCSEDHLQSDVTKHREICQAISDVKQDLNQDYLFNIMKTGNDPMKPISTHVNEANARILFKAKLIMLIAQKMNRGLNPRELLMFNHPRVCSVCFESDPALLKNCPECPQATFCKIHLNNSDHKEKCPKFAIAFNIESNAKMTQELIESIKDVTIDLQKRSRRLPSSIHKFIETFVHEPIMIDRARGQKSLIHVTMLSERFTMPLSLLFAMEKLKYKPVVKLIVHLIGATEDEFTCSNWEIILHWLPNLTELKLILISPNILLGGEQIYNVCSLCEESKKNLVVEVETSLYEEYFKSEHFKKPDIIVGFNLSLRVKPSWDEALQVIKCLTCPFLITTYNQVEAFRQQGKTCSALITTNAKCSYFQPNPFASMIYMRNYVDEGVLSKNAYLLIYKRIIKMEAEL